jgi:hypothetical protein
MLDTTAQWIARHTTALGGVPKASTLPAAM